MPRYNRGVLDRVAREHGFVRDTFEKVLRLKEILLFLNIDDYLRERLALKGGTAINLMIFNLPRLSVDIDLDFMLNLSRQEVKPEREKITAIIKAYMKEEGYYLSEASRGSHSLDAFLFQYENAAGNRDNIKIEVNYSLRAHLFAPTVHKIIPEAFTSDIEICILKPIEIFAAKTNALINRATARDLYDFNNMINSTLFKETEYELLRKCIVFYAAISAKRINEDFDTSAISEMNFSKIRRDLFPLLREVGDFNLENRKEQAQDFIHKLMVLSSKEKEYLNYFKTGKYKPELLFDNERILDNIREHPMALWKTKKYQDN